MTAIFELSTRPATDDIPTFMRLCRDIGYPETPTLPPAPEPHIDDLQNLAPHAQAIQAGAS